MSLARLTDVDAERAFVMVFVAHYGRSYYQQVADIINADCFTDKMCADIWRAIVQIEEQQQEVNTMSVYTQLMQNGVTVDFDYLVGDTYNAVSLRIEDAIYLRDLADRRQLYIAMTTMAKQLTQLDIPVEDQLSRVKTIADGIGGNDVGDVTLSGMMCELLSSCEARMNGELTEGWRSGFDIIDEVGALQPSDLNVIAGESSQGKTAFALNVALNVVKTGIPVAIYSLEMGAQQLASRLACIESEALPSTTIQYRKLTDEQFGQLYSSVMGLVNYPMYFNFRSNHELSALEQSIRRMVLNYEVKVVVIDYLQLLSGGDGNDRVGELAKITRRLKNLAKDLNICILLLSQLNRGEAANPVPTIKRLRGSGEIEEAADNIYMVYRAEVYGKQWPGGWSTYPTMNRALVFRGKSRNGGKGERLLEFIPEYTKFKNMKATPSLAAMDAPAPKKASYEDSPF